MEALREATAELTVYVHPSNAADVRLAVSRQLSTLLFSYEDRFDGVLLSHEVEFEGDNEDVLDGLVPYFGVPVTANMLLFSPQPEMILEGKVEMLGKESIHAIVLGVFSAAIMADDIPEMFKFKRRGHGGKFISQSDKRHVIKKGSMIRFSVKRYGLIQFLFCLVQIAFPGVLFPIWPATLHILDICIAFTLLVLLILLYVGVIHAYLSVLIFFSLLC
uniref:DNA-directed RNA polymerase subunit n=1 Tax=Aegilops tauschii subsp. strangulata TaxID=200361 RepID=A0A453KK92_AEGTS